ncbi:MAG: DUF3592 domain-containing protein [Anaeromyxobacter sp.]
MLHLAARHHGGKARPGVAAAALLVAALAFLGLAAFLGQDAEGIVRNLGTAPGTVVGIDLRKAKGDKKPRATIRYEVEGSTIWLTNERVSRDVSEGDVLTVHYDRREPAHASLSTPGELRARYLVLIGLGTALLVVAAIFFGVATRERGTAAPPYAGA